MKYYKHSAELHIDKKLKALLEPFKTIEDFKIYYSVRINKHKLRLIEVKEFVMNKSYQTSVSIMHLTLILTGGRSSGTSLS